MTIARAVTICFCTFLTAGNAVAEDSDIATINANNYYEVRACIEAYEFADVTQQAPVYDEWCPSFAQYIHEQVPIEMASGYKGDCSSDNIKKIAYALLERKRLEAGGPPFVFKTVAHANMTISRLEPILLENCPS